jgi:hypothetical protein
MRVGTSLSWLWKKIQRPVFIRVVSAKFLRRGAKAVFSAASGKSRHHRTRGRPPPLCRVRQTLKSVMNLHFAIHYAGGAKSAEIHWEYT